MKAKLFIGSSFEALSIARGLQALLTDDFDVKVWDAAFIAGELFLESLQKELFITDYALFIIAPDDKINKRGTDGFITRDNVIFELGMFVGALGIKKAYFIVAEIVQDGVKISPTIPSDLDGIKKTKIKLDADADGVILNNDTNSRALDTAADVIGKMLKVKKGLTLNLLPSTSLAIGYYRNFILQACKELSLKADFEVAGKQHDLTRDAFDFYIIIPDKGQSASHAAYEKFVRDTKLNHIQIKPSNPDARPYPFFIQSDLKNGRLQLYDYPTTLRASSDAIQLVMPANTDEDEIEELELKEIANFKATLEFLLKKPEAAGYRDNIHLVTATQIANAQ